MKRKSTAYYIVCLLLLVLLVGLLSVSVWAQETTLTANVPFVHTLHIELTGNGRIVIDGVPYEKTADIQINRHSAPDISIEPDSGWELESVFLDSQDITSEFQEGTFPFPEMREDVKLTVVFDAISDIPQTGDKISIEILSLIMLLSVIGMLLCVMARRRTRTNDK